MTKLSNAFAGPLQTKAAKANPTLAKAAAALAIYEGVHDLYHTGKQFYLGKLEYKVGISEDDELYPDMATWVLQNTPTGSQRSLNARVSSRSSSRFVEEPTSEDGSSASKSKNDVVIGIDDSESKTLMLDGHRIVVRLEQEERRGTLGETNDRASMIPPRTLRFTSRTKAGQQAIIKKIEEVRASRKAHVPRIRYVSGWGGWTSQDEAPIRTLDSVVLPPAQKAEIVSDMRQFLDDEPRYVDLALPWHRGYLLHGPPGTGKTSLVKALANEFKLDLWYISLGDLDKEASLIGLLSGVRPRSILLLEDVDTLKLTHDRAEKTDSSDSGSAVTLSSLLNALDGVLTPHGMITFMTTNHYKTLDPALVRVGRMDKTFELSHPRAQEVATMYRRFYNRGLPSIGLGTGRMKFSQAELSEALKQHMNDHVAGAEAIAALHLAKSAEAMTASAVK